MTDGHLKTKDIKFDGNCCSFLSWYKNLFIPDSAGRTTSLSSPKDSTSFKVSTPFPLGLKPRGPCSSTWPDVESVKIQPPLLQLLSNIVIRKGTLAASETTRRNQARESPDIPPPRITTFCMYMNYYCCANCPSYYW